MKKEKCLLIFVFLWLGSLLASLSPGLTNQEIIDSADKLFQAGKFAEAERLYLEAAKGDPQNFRVLVHLGRIALLSNRLAEAEKWLTLASKVRPEERVPKTLLAEIFYRRDDFQKAARFFRAAGREAMAQKLESFKGLIPYRLKENTPGLTHLTFLMTDPLPVIEVQVNRKSAVNFFLDTGASEIIIDSELAKEAGATVFELEKGTLAGARKPIMFTAKLTA